MDSHGYYFVLHIWKECIGKVPGHALGWKLVLLLELLIGMSFLPWFCCPHMIIIAVKQRLSTRVVDGHFSCSSKRRDIKRVSKCILLWNEFGICNQYTTVYALGCLKAGFASSWTGVALGNSCCHLAVVRKVFSAMITFFFPSEPMHWSHPIISGCSTWMPIWHATGVLYQTCYQI